MENEIRVPGWSGTVHLFVKIGKQDHLQKLMNGFLRFRDLGYYASLENSEKGYHDPRELVHGIFQADKVKLKVISSSKEFTLDSSTGLINQLFFGYSKSNKRILCFHTLADGIWENNEVDFSDCEAVNNHFKIPAHFMNKFDGEYAWIILNPEEFISRISKTIESVPNMPYGLRYGPVHYIDFKAVHGEIAYKDLGFIKGKHFAEEKEFRFIALSSETLPDPFELDIGNLSDISVILPLDKLKIEYSKSAPELLPESSQKIMKENEKK